MAVRYNQAAQNGRLDAVITQVDANASPAFLEITNAAYALVLATITLGKPAFTRSGTAPSTKLSLNGLPRSDTSADNTGTAALARIKDGGGTIVIDQLTCGVGSGDVQLNSLSITAGQTVTITAADITHPNP